MTFFPVTIKFISDDTTVQFVEEIFNKEKIRTGKYKYVKVHKKSTSKGKEFIMTLDQIEKLANDKLITIK